MASKARKIPLENWELHKETILNLYLTSDLSVKELVQTLEKEHGFAATLSQFEAQLRVWKARKNLKNDEWEVILPKIDNLSARGIQTRVVIAGHPVPADRVHRARRYFKEYTERPRKRRRTDGDPDQEMDSTDGSATIEFQDSNGNWNLYVGVAGDDVPPQLQLPDVNEALDPTEQDVQVENVPAQVITYPVSIDPLSFSDISFELSPHHDVNLVTYSQPVNSEDRSLSQNTGFQGQVIQSPMSFEHDINFELPVLQLENPELQLNNPTGTFPFSVFLKDLPFERFESGLLSKYHHLMRSPSPTVDCRLLSGARGPNMEFFYDVVTAMTKANGKSAHENFPSARLVFQTLDKLLPDSQLHSGNNNSTCLSQSNPNIEIYRALLYSIANGLSGISGVILGVIPRFLEQSSDIMKLLPQLSHSSPNYVAKGLAENLFRVCIESGSHDAIRLILKTGLVDVNEICCFSNGHKYTPLERAAQLQKLQAVHELLRYKADTNRSYSKGTWIGPDKRRGALARLIYGIAPTGYSDRSHSAFTQDWLDTVDALIQAGAEIRTSHIETALTRFVRMDLAEKLLHGLKPVDLCEILCDPEAEEPSLLALIASNLTDEGAKKEFTKILVTSGLEWTRCKADSQLHLDRVHDAICVGARRGHIQLVRDFFQYANDSAELLAAAIVGGNDELVSFVLAQNPSMRPTGGRRITPLSAAIEAGNHALVRELESKGALKHLDHEDNSNYSRRFASAVSAAAQVGDIQYVKKLLLLYPNFRLQALEGALERAHLNGHENIVHLLLDIGVGTSPNTSRILSHIYIQAYDNKSLLSNLISCYPDIDIMPPGDRLERELELGNMDMLDFFARSGILIRGVLGDCLPVAVRRRDPKMFRHLLELGADMSILDHRAVRFGVELYTDLLLMLQHAPPMEACIQPLGSRILIRAIATGTISIEKLNLLISCKAMDFKSMENISGYSATCSPLGMAIVKESEGRQSTFPLTSRLLDAGCDINRVAWVEKDERGFRVPKTPLLMAIEMKNEPLVRLLIDHGVEINAKAAFGIRKTPLQAAVEVGSFNLVQLLLQNGADVNANPATFHGGTTLQYAAMSGNCNVATLLLDNGADMSTPPSTFGGRWPIEAAAEHGRLDMIQFLWNASFGSGFPTEQCRKAIELAKENSHRACADLIRDMAVSNGIILTPGRSE
ncbi:hypothetical protein Daesc_001541 [Daldinia eschscholtzii]|uniref:Clr5 domain-containing protein n=1 Tax=Daldinia eschscholtzii TaxID=292717 RepID=A0AAX6MV40_9PEZI